MGDETTIYLEWRERVNGEWVELRSYNDARSLDRPIGVDPRPGRYRWRVGRESWSADLSVVKAGLARVPLPIEVREAWEAAREAALYRAPLPHVENGRECVHYVTNHGDAEVVLAQTGRSDGLRVPAYETAELSYVVLASLEARSTEPIRLLVYSHHDEALVSSAEVGPGERQCAPPEEVGMPCCQDDGSDIDGVGEVRNAPVARGTYGRVQVSSDGGETWRDLRSLTTAGEWPKPSPAIDIRAQLVDGIGSDVLERCAGEWVGTGIGWALRLHESGDTHWLASVIDCGDPREMCGQISLCDCGESALLYESVVGPTPDCDPGSEALSVAQQLRPRIEAALDLVERLRGLGDED